MESGVERRKHSERRRTQKMVKNSTEMVEKQSKLPQVSR